MAEQEKASPVDATVETEPESASETESNVMDDRSKDRSESAGENDLSNGEGDRDDFASKSEAAESAEVVELRNKVRELESENTELKNQYLRKQADMENYRKRMIRDKESAVQFSNQQLLLDMTSIIDDFERAIRSAEESRDYDSFHDGIVLIENQLTNMLDRKWGLKRFDSEGEEFDPQRHEAVTTEARPDHNESIVLEDYQHGYLLHDRVLRSAKVKVSMPVETNEETDKE